MAKCKYKIGDIVTCSVVKDIVTGKNHIKFSAAGKEVREVDVKIIGLPCPSWIGCDNSGSYVVQVRDKKLDSWEIAPHSSVAIDHKIPSRYHYRRGWFVPARQIKRAVHLVDRRCKICFGKK